METQNNALNLEPTETDVEAVLVKVGTAKKIRKLTGISINHSHRVFRERKLGKSVGELLQLKLGIHPNLVLVNRSEVAGAQLSV